jgi:hypothetical protein
MIEKRKQKIVHPRLQGRFLTLLLTAAGASVLVHAGLMVWALSSLAAELPHDARRLQDAIPGTVVLSSLATLLAVVPLFLVLGISGTFRVFGPLYRFRVFLEQVARGKHREPCRIRSGDELQDICQLLNTVTEPMRMAASVEDRAEGQPESRAA